MTKTEVQRLRERLEAEYKKKLDAVAMVEEMLAEDEQQLKFQMHSSNGKGAAPVGDTGAADDADEVDSDTLIGRIAGLFADPTKRWTVNRLVEELTRQGYKFQGLPSHSIHTSLAKLRKRGVVRVARHGKGSKPSLYAGMGETKREEQTT